MLTDIFITLFNRDCSPGGNRMANYNFIKIATVVQ